MNGEEPDLERLRRLVGHVVVEGDVLEIASGLWAIHGYSTYEGEIILQEYESVAEAAWVLTQLPPPGPDHLARPSRPAGQSGGGER